MIVLQCARVSKSFGATPILNNVKLEIQTKERIALVGRNGAGKSTLLKAIVGETGVDEGDISIPKHVTIGYLAQHTALNSTRSIWDEMCTVFSSLREMEVGLQQLESEMATPPANEPPSAAEKRLQAYDAMQIAFKDQGGYQYEADIRTILSGFGFATFDYSTPITTLSGGQKTRLSLAKLLLTKPDLLVLDEPTNHLDMATLTWLEQYLQSYTGAILIVSHDRYFLDKIATGVIELSRTRTTTYKGNYSYYLTEKARRYEQDLKQYEKQQTAIANMEQFVAKNLARASTTKRAQSRRKQLEKMDRLDRPEGSEKQATFSFTIQKQTGNDVLTIDNLTVAYEDEPIFSGLNLSLTRGESIAFIGKNGAGKSTLLKAITKQLTPQTGTISFGSNVILGYYDQEHAKLSSGKTILQEVWDDYPSFPEQKIRTTLGQFLFSGDDVLKTVSSLSGGERARVALAKLMLQQANVLLLDEPTNHLDLEAKEVLEAALVDYPGTIIFISHDRYFINRLATRIVELANGTVTNYLGNYDDYIEKKQAQAERAALTAPQVIDKPINKKQSFQQDKEAQKRERKRLRRIEAIEQEIEETDAQLSALEQKLAEPEVYSDHVAAAKIQEEIDTLNKRNESLMEEWETLQS
ncbi:ATP-binding cassette domain-containing protein [Bacillus sp. FSL W7-1360]